MCTLKLYLQNTSYRLHFAPSLFLSLSLSFSLCLYLSLSLSFSLSRAGKIRSPRRIWWPSVSLWRLTFNLWWPIWRPRILPAIMTSILSIVFLATKLSTLATKNFSSPVYGHLSLWAQRPKTMCFSAWQVSAGCWFWLALRQVCLRPPTYVFQISDDK